MSFHEISEIRASQLRAIDIMLEVAPKMQKEFVERFHLDESLFGWMDLIDYRIQNSAIEIAEELSFKEKYNLTTYDMLKNTVSQAFVGYQGEHFPDQHFEGLFGSELMKLIKKSRQGVHGKRISDKGIGIHSLDSDQRSENGKLGYFAAGWDNRTSEELSERMKQTLSKINPKTGETYAVTSGRARGLNSKELGLGIFARSDEQKTLDGRLGGRAAAIARGYKLWYDEYGNPSELLEDLINLTENPENQHISGTHKGRPYWDLVHNQLSERYPNQKFKIPSLRVVVCKYKQQIQN